MKKAVTWLLVLTMLLGSLAACSENSTETNDETKGNSVQPDAEEEVVVEEDVDTLADNLPAKDFEGADFRISADREDMIEKFYVEEYNGDVVNDAVRSANVAVMERFNVNIMPIMQDTLASVRATVAANDNAFEVGTMHDIEGGNLALAGYFRNAAAIPYFDFTKPWWPKYSVDSLTVDGAMYIFANYISYQNLTQTNAIFMNKDLATNFNIEVPYEAVRNGEWDLDMFTSLFENVYVDTNGNGQRDVEDTFGFVHNGDWYGIQESFGITPVKEDDNGRLYIDMDNERTYSMIEKFYHMMVETEGGWLNSAGNQFSKGLTLFYMGNISYATNLREVDIDYAFLPMPKLDELQEYYISGSTDRPYGIPVTSTNDELLGIIIEAMSAEGYKQIRPAYFDVAMKQKYASDRDSAEMLEIVGDTIVLDFSYIYSNYNNFSWTLMKMITPGNPNSDFASFYAKNIKVYSKTLEKVQKAFDDMKETNG